VILILGDKVTLIDSVVKDCYKRESEIPLYSCKLAVDKLGLPPFLVNLIVNKAFKSHLNL
jgi:hypothetical protein